MNLKKNPIITFEELLINYSQEELYKTMIGEYPQLDKYYCSFFRKDNNASCYFKWYNNILYFVDWVEKNRNVLTFCSDLYGISIGQSIFFLNNKMDGIETKIPPRQIEKSKKIKEKKSLNVISRNWKIKDKEFWEKYGISIEQLSDDLVSPVSSIIIGDKVISPIDLTYNILINREKNIKKTYRPFSEKKKYKFMTNATKNDIGNVNNIDYSKNYLVITKSYKDCRVLRNFDVNSIWLQSENQFPDQNLLISILRNFQTIIIFFDNDSVGIEKSAKFKNYLNKLSLDIEIVEIFSETSDKDISDLYKSKGRDCVNKFVNEQIFSRFLDTSSARRIQE